MVGFDQMGRQLRVEERQPSPHHLCLGVLYGGDYFTVGYNTRKVMKKIVSGTVSVFLLSSEFGLREFLHGFRYAA